MSISNDQKRICHKAFISFYHISFTEPLNGCNPVMKRMIKNISIGFRHKLEYSRGRGDSITLILALTCRMPDFGKKRLSTAEF